MFLPKIVLFEMDPSDSSPPGDDPHRPEDGDSAPHQRSPEPDQQAVEPDQQAVGPDPHLRDPGVAQRGDDAPLSVATPPTISLSTSEDCDAESKLVRCQEILGYSFRDPDLLLSALTHASGASHRLASNERLEFLGDAVLGLVVCQWLFQAYPQYSEGDLTKVKSAVVSRRSCARVACQMGLDECLIVGRGVTQNRSFPRSLVSDVFEAVIAALYLDADIELVRKRLRQWLAEEVRLAIENQGAGNFKSTLQQVAQRDYAATPIYQLVRETGPDHRKSFLMAAVIDSRTFAAAWGNSKKDAEQRAASNALAELRGDVPPFLASDEPDSEKMPRRSP